MTRLILAAGPVIKPGPGYLPFRSVLWVEYDGNGKVNKYVVHKQFLQESGKLSLSNGDYFESRNYPDQEPERTWMVHNTYTGKTLREGFESAGDAMHWLTSGDNDLNHGQKAGAVVMPSAPKTAVGRAWAKFNDAVTADLRTPGPAPLEVVAAFHQQLDVNGWSSVTMS